MSYSQKEKLASPENYGGERTAASIQYLVIHYTGNVGDSAAGNAAYFRNHVVKASAHYFVDDSAIYRSVPDLRTAWAVGGTRWADCAKTGGGSLYGVVTNVNSISIELCGTAGDGTARASVATMENAAALCRDLMTRYKISKERVVRHFDVTGKHCPAYLMDEEAWARFKARLEEPMDNQPAAYAKEAVAWARETGIMTGNAAGDLMLNQPVTRQQLVTMLYRYYKQFHKLLEQN